MSGLFGRSPPLTVFSLVRLVMVMRKGLSRAWELGTQDLVAAASDTASD